MCRLHENTLQSYYEAQAPARMPYRTTLIKQTKIRANSSDWAEYQAAKHGQLAKSSTRAQILMNSLPIGKKYASPYNSKVQECFPPFKVYV